MTTRRDNAKTIPTFHSVEEAAAFWETHSFDRYWDESKQVTLQLGKTVKHYFLSELRLPVKQTFLQQRKVVHTQKKKVV